MSQKGIERMAMVFSNLQTANYDLLQMATDKDAGVDVTGKQSHQDMLFAKLCEEMNDFAKDKFMDIIKFAPKQ